MTHTQEISVDNDSNIDNNKIDDDDNDDETKNTGNNSHPLRSITGQSSRETNSKE